MAGNPPRREWIHPDRAELALQHPDWRLCLVCRWPVDPWVCVSHPICDPDKPRCPVCDDLGNRERPDLYCPIRTRREGGDRDGYLA